MSAPQTPPAAPRFTAMTEIALFNQVLDRTLILRRTPDNVVVYLYAGRRAAGKEPLVSGFNTDQPPAVFGLKPPAMALQWLDVGHNMYALDRAEAEIVALWLAAKAHPEAAAAEPKAVVDYGFPPDAVPFPGTAAQPEADA
ncbi:MAG: hypothetical protein U0973_11585 [Xanthomonadaceae bacterium]|nr:hypothetical protein [Xanthomonadaceae bacterium]